MAEQTTPELDRIAAWLEHQLRLLEILRYRFDGLERLLRAGQDEMLIQAIDEIEDVRSQIGVADLHRDIAVSALAADWSLPSMPVISEIIDRVDEATAERLRTLRHAITEETTAISELQLRCATLSNKAIERVSALL